jgi:peptidyl-prolyl cis-trans isomerase C
MRISSCALLLTGALVVTGVAAAQGSTTESSTTENATIVTVNGEAVTAAEVRVMMQNLASQLGQGQQQIDQQQLFQAATQQAVDTKLLAQEARRREISLDTATVDGVMAQLEQQSGGREALDAFLGNMGLTYEDFKGTVGESVLVQSLVEQEIRPGVEVSDQEVEEFYQGNPQMFQQPEQVRARHILITVEQGADEATKADAKARAEAARKRAVSGEDFAALATELSEGPSAPNGGDLGFFSADRMVPAFAEAAFALEPGAISQVVETQFGYHVIKVEERRPAATQSLDEVKEPLRNALLEREVGEGVASLVEELRAQATIVPTAGPTTSTPSDAG